MDSETPQIYGLEFQARSLTSQQHESDTIRFFVGTQSLKLTQNQVHVIEVNDDNTTSQTTICPHNQGEVWHISASPHSADVISTVYNTTDENVCLMKSAIWRIKDAALELGTQLPIEEHGHEVKQTWLHPTDALKALSIVDNHYVVWDLAAGGAKSCTTGSLEGKGQPRFTCGKWNPHHNVSQVATANEGTVRGWDVRTSAQAWAIESAHSQVVRDFDFNPNRQYYLATCGDDGFTRFWDIRSPSNPLVSRSDHSHWVWAVRYNHFHDQLILTSSSDSRVILSCVSGISSEPAGHMISGDEDVPREKLEEGVVCRYDEHEDSVYAVEWSHSDPWTFASLSYDGRLVINTVPRSPAIAFGSAVKSGIHHGFLTGMAADSDGEPNAGFATRAPCSAHKLGVIGRNELRQAAGTCEEDNDLIKTVFTCHGNLEDPDFPQRFSRLLDQLSSILFTGKDVLMQRVKKIEPWNSVRVTLTIPREAAARLRALAAAGDAALLALGILSVQLEGDQVISLRLAAQFGGEPQEIVLRTGGSSTDAAAVSSADATPAIAAGPVTALLQAVPGPSTSGSSSSGSGFRSPNVVAPAANAVIPPSPRPHSGPSPFPFTSMTHAAQTQQARQDSPHHNFTAPPPYAAKPFTPVQRAAQLPTPATGPASTTIKVPAVLDTTVSLASPLLVNLLQTDGKDGKEVEPRLRQPAPSTPRPRPLTKPFAPRTGPPRFPQPTPRFPASTTSAKPGPAAVPAATATTMAARPAFSSTSVVKEPTQPRSVLQGYSQFTASSSKPCTLNETNATSEEKSNTADGKKLIINPLTGELEPMPSESSDSEGDSKYDPFFSLSSNSSSVRGSSEEDSMVNRRESDQSDSDVTPPSKSNGAESAARRRVGLHKPGAAAAAAGHVHAHAHGHVHLHAPEKIKLRFMVDKPEAGAAPASAYKVDLSFSPSVRKAISSSGNRSMGTAVVGASAVSNATPSAASTALSSQLAAEEPRVPPLHISLRGRNATVVSNKKKPPHWLLDEEDLYSKLPKKKLKLGSGSAKDGRDSVAITNCDLTQTQKPKRAKVKRALGDGEGLKLKIPVTPDMDVSDLCDEKLSKKRKDSKKVKNNVRHSDSDGDAKVSLKMDSEEWISRTLKEETLRHGVPLPGQVDGQVPVSESAETVSAVVPTGERPRASPVKEVIDAPPVVEPARTNAFKPGNLELSELLRCKQIENSSKKLDCLKIKNKLFVDSVDETEESAEGVTSVKKPQEIGGKIKSELSSKIDRVSGKLKNDLSKDGISKKKLEDTAAKGIKCGARSKPVKKEGGARIAGAISTEGDGDDLAFSRAKRRHSGDQSAPESQAQKVKRSSSSDQPSPLNKLPVANRRFDALTRKIRKDYVIDRLRKDKLGKATPLNSKLNPVGDLNSKKVHSNRTASGNGAVKSVDATVTAQALTVLPALIDVKPVLTRLDGDPEKLKESAGVEGNTQGEDSGIESMDALSEKSPNQGESPCRKDEGGKEMEDGKRGQNHDRTDEEEGKELPDNSCLTLGNSNQETHPPQAHSVPFECSSQNNNSVEPEPETSTKLNEPADDGLIDSFGIKIREAFRRDEDPSREGLAAKILEGSSKDWGKKTTVKTEDGMDNKEPRLDGPDAGQDALAEAGKEWTKDGSPSLEDMERFRVNPPLYTYAKREDSLSPSPTTVEGSEQRNHIKEEETSSRSGTSQQGKSEDAANETSADAAVPGGRSLRNKSLLEQLLIEIPEDTRRTRSWHKLGSSPGETPKSSPRPGSPSVARPSPRAGSKPSPTPRTSKRPSKRKCSENASELIKACMGVEEVKASKTGWKRGDVESSDDEPLSDLARSREHSVEQDTKPNVLKTKLKQIVEDESRNNNKVGVKVVADPPTRRSVRQTQGGIGKGVKTVADVRTVRSTRSALCQETFESGNKRRRTSRDGK